MYLAERFVATITYVVSFFSLSGIDDFGNKQQAPLFDSPLQVHDALLSKGPLFKPPTGRSSKFPGGDLVCDYTAMGSDWTNCSTSENRGCWLNNTRTLEQFNITTDYEDPNKMPKGIDRYYNLSITDGWIFADGLNFTQAKFFWNTSDPESFFTKYPGPWVQACWGDTVHINVFNDLEFNGTSVHWHGIRQLNTTHMDGVPGVTQCPIAPQKNFTYTWKARQYGSSWYHSHYSVQYADGALGPLTIHGPSSDNWDEAKFPILMTDWGHNSAFQAIWTKSTAPLGAPGLLYASTLLNGVGDVSRWNSSVNKNTCMDSDNCFHGAPDPYNITFSSTPIKGRRKRYLLRLINTSFESTFIFAIDNHELQVVSTDFVAIKPYSTRSVTIGIGQRYNVIVNAQPIDETGKPILGIEKNGFWMRTWWPKCFRFPQPTGQFYEQSGILLYDNFNTAPKPGPPPAGWSVDTTVCTDEPYEKLTPRFSWQVPRPNITELTGRLADNFTVNIAPDNTYYFPLSLFSMGGDKFNPFYIDYGNPIFLNLQYGGEWPPRWVVYREPHPGLGQEWAYLIIKSGTGPHPIHLHGHDFVILQQNATMESFPNNITLNTNNPPRRDVVLLPNKGFVIIAFKLDNPGPWIMHCHIAYHASFGLAAQIMESQSAAKNIWPPGDSAIEAAQSTCNDWTKWWGDCNNRWYDKHAGQKPGHYCLTGEEFFAPDSGI